MAKALKKDIDTFKKQLQEWEKALMASDSQAAQKIGKDIHQVLSRWDYEDGLGYHVKSY
jgi:hypothetical protein